MAYNVPEGAVFYFSSTFASAKTITALTNASPASATSTSHGFVDNDEILLTSGWEDATDTVWRVDQTDANSFGVLGLNSTNTNYFAAGSGTGSAQLISAWTTIPQVLSVSSSGGDPKRTTVQPLAKRNAFNITTGFNPTDITLTLAHDSSNANFITMLDLSRTLTDVAFKMVLSGGNVTYGYGTLTVSEVPALNVGQVNTVTCSISLRGRSVSYDT